MPQYRYTNLLKKYPLLDTMKKLMVPGFAEDDLVLQAIIVLGAISADPKAGTFLAQRPMLKLFVAILREKSEDEEFCLQLVFTLYLFSHVKRNQKYFAFLPESSKIFV